MGLKFARRGGKAEKGNYGLVKNYLDVLTTSFLVTPKRDSSTARPDLEIDKTDLQEREKRRDASLRMTTPTATPRTTNTTPVTI
jgi:hypothetical protein